jgi:type VI secretion system secreted protein Hcp
MALNAYLSLTGQSQGLIEGSVDRATLVGKIEVIETKFLVHYPLDAVSGLQTANKKNKPITIIKEVDKSSPLLYSAWMNNENITQWRLDFYRPDGTGSEVQYYSIELENASIASIRFEQPNTRDPETQGLAEQEQITFTYGKITLTHQPTGAFAEDDLSSS